VTHDRPERVKVRVGPIAAMLDHATDRFPPGTPCRSARVHGRGEFCGALSRISILFDSIRVRARRTSRKPTFARTRIYPTIRPNGTDFIMPALRCGCKPERVDEAGAQTRAVDSQRDSGCKTVVPAYLRRRERRHACRKYYRYRHYLCPCASK